MINLNYTRLTVYSNEEGVIFPHLTENLFKDKFPEFICAICLSFVKKAVSCKECDVIFCNECIHEYSKYSNTCIHRCVLSLKPISRVLRNMIDTAVINCPFISKGCTRKVTYTEFETHVNECEYGPYMCLGENCFYVNTMIKTVLHTKSCELLNEPNVHEGNEIPENCPHCSLKFESEVILVHVYTCPSQVISCKECHIRLTQEEYTSHANSNVCLVNQYENKISSLQEKLNYQANLISIMKEEINNSKYSDNFSCKTSKDKYRSYSKGNVTNEGKVLRQESYSIEKKGSNCLSLDNLSDSYKGIQSIEEINMKFMGLKVSPVSLVKTSECSLFSFFPDGKVDTYDFDNEDKQILLDPKDEVSCVNYFYNKFILGTNKGCYLIYNEDLELVTKKKFCTSKVTHIDSYVTQDDHNFICAFGTYMSNIHIIDCSTGDILHVLNHRNKEILSLLFISELSLLISSAKDKKVSIWREGKLHSSIQGHTDIVWCLNKLRLNEDTLLVSGSGDKSIRLWSLHSIKKSECVTFIPIHDDSVTALETMYLGKESLLISGSYDGVIKITLITTIRTYHCYKSIYFHKEKINHIRSYTRSNTSLDNLTLVTSSDDCPMHIFYLTVRHNLSECP